MKRILLPLLAAAALCARAYDPIVYPTNAPSGDVIAPFLATNVVANLLADAISTNAPQGEIAALRMILADVAEQVRAMPGGDDYDEIVDATLALAYSNQITRAEAAALYAPKTNAVTPATLAAVTTLSALNAAPAAYYGTSHHTMDRTANPICNVVFYPSDFEVEIVTQNTGATLQITGFQIEDGPPRYLLISGDFGAVDFSESGFTNLVFEAGGANLYEFQSVFGYTFARRLVP